MRKFSFSRVQGALESFRLEAEEVIYVIFMEFLLSVRSGGNKSTRQFLASISLQSTMETEIKYTIILISIKYN